MEKGNNRATPVSTAPQLLQKPTILSCVSYPGRAFGVGSVDSYEVELQLQHGPRVSLLCVDRLQNVSF